MARQMSRKTRANIATRRSLLFFGGPAVAAACSGFVYAYATAHAYINSGMATHVLVIGATLLTRFLAAPDRHTCIIIRTGSGTDVTSASHAPRG